MNDDEQLVLLDESFKPIGSAPKLASHHANTPLHLAFSCYVFNENNELLVTQRALSKKVWPGVWSNSFCGHPTPGEAMEDAIKRRAAYELGIENLRDICCAVPEYRYTTPPYNGIIENEFCPVYVARMQGVVLPNSSEVGEWKFMSWDEFRADMSGRPGEYSYWVKQQAVLMDSFAVSYLLKGKE